MTFRVYLAEDAMGASNGVFTFDDASTWSIDDNGYLYIIALGQTQAVFPPGRWVCIRKVCE